MSLGSKHETEVVALLSIAAIALAWATPGLAAGSVPWLPLLVCGLALICAANGPSRSLVIEKTCAFVDARPHRWLLIVFGASLMWQLVGVELAMLLAGDVLLYLEMVTAVGLMSANARLAPVTAKIAHRIAVLRDDIRAVWRRADRAPRSPRPPRARRPSSLDPEGDAGWAMA